MSVSIIAAQDHHLQGILDLQEQNLKQNLSAETIQNQGFLTVKHDFDILKKMNDVHPHTIAVDNDIVVGFALAMHKQFANDIPFLTALFSKIDRHLKTLNPNDPLNYIVMGQVCVGAGYRSQGIFVGMYHDLRDRLSHIYDAIFTDIDCMNERSLRAHQKVGFESIEIFKVDNGDSWNIVKWQW